MAKAKRTAKKAPSKDRINKSGHSMNPGNGYEHRIESSGKAHYSPVVIKYQNATEIKFAKVQIP